MTPFSKTFGRGTIFDIVFLQHHIAIACAYELFHRVNYSRLRILRPISQLGRNHRPFFPSPRRASRTIKVASRNFEMVVATAMRPGSNTPTVDLGRRFLLTTDRRSANKTPPTGARGETKKKNYSYIFQKINGRKKGESDARGNRRKTV